MANISSTNGTLIITAPTGEDVDDFIDQFINMWAKKGTYAPEPIEHDDQVKFDTQEVNGSHRTEFLFEGQGKWTFINTLTSLQQISNELTPDYIQHLKDRNLSITTRWEFNDFECGLQVLYKGSCTIIFSSEGVKVIESSAEDQPYTAENIQGMGFIVPDELSS